MIPIYAVNTLKSQRTDIVLHIPTKSIAIEPLPEQNSHLRVSRLSLVDLRNVLNQSKGYYVPPVDFGKMMSQVKLGYGLAYGKKIDEFTWCLSVLGYERWIVTLVADIYAITWTVNNQV